MENDIEALATAVQKGESYAFEKLFQQFQQKAVRTAYFITKNHALAEDVAQEAFVQAYFKITSLKEPSQFPWWFYKILTRVAWRSLKKEGVTLPVQDIFQSVESTLEKEEPLEEHYIQQEQNETLWQAVQQLNLKQRTTVLLYYYNEFSVAEIAKIMGCFSGTVKSRLYTARKMLKKQLEQEKLEQKEEAKDAILYKI